MNEHNTHSQTDKKTRVIAADMPLSTSRYPVKQLLEAFAKLCQTDDDVRLILSGKRCSDEIFSIWNFIDQHQLTDRVEFLPYYHQCDHYPVKKTECDVWISRNTPGSILTAQYLQNRLDDPTTKKQKYALFFTSFHPEKEEGNSTLMRLWLDHLKDAGYIVHVVYYMYDIGNVTADMRRASLQNYDIYKEVPVSSKLTGANYNGLNVHVDDWCGIEALDAIDQLVDVYEYDIAITNYPFMSAVFHQISAYTNKILLTHDSFVDRNRRMLEQGYPESGWISLDARGEQLACERSDVVVAMQEHEAAKFREDSDPEKVCVIGPIFEKKLIERPQAHDKLRIGYFGSSNWVNEQNLGEYLKHWANDSELMERSEIHIAGGICKTLKDFVPAALLRKVNAHMVGRVDKPGDFFSTCDVIINPERGGTGIKIKTLESLAHGMPIITTKSGFVGIETTNALHQAAGFSELVADTKMLLDSPEKIDQLREDCVSIYDRYVSLQVKRMNELLGEPVKLESILDENVKSSTPRKRQVSEIKIPSYVKETASKYHFEEFERFISREEVRGKRVLEIGSDFHLASARLFMANGADSVVATNIGDWKSEEPMPDGVEFKVCDASDADLPEQGFDIIYGIAIIEHVPDFQRLCKSLKRFLKPDGVIYFQGCPLWAGTLGHHVWYAADTENSETSGDKESKPLQYSFTANNPVPNWAHLAMNPDDLALLLIEKGIPQDHAQGIVNYVYNLDGTMIGSCSNFFSASEVLGVMKSTFDVEVDRIWSKDKPNEYFDIARKDYSEEDLRTLGLRVWMTHTDSKLLRSKVVSNPKVSIIIPFYGVQDFIGECIASVLKQDYQNLEVIFVDDQSKDGSREIVEKHIATDDRFTLLTHEHNQGLGPARNTGVNHATGMYLFFLDSDDYLSSKSAISMLIENAQSTGAQVVVGSCDRIMTDGQRLDFDRDFDRTQSGTPDMFVDGMDAFLGSSFIPGGKYVPMRAWGTLIDRFMYLESGLEYPAAEHEDLPHTPFLYHYAKKVLYISDIVVTYRDRSDSISNTGWDSGKIRRQGLIWKNIHENLLRFNLENLVGDCAVKTAEHLIMKLRQNGIQTGSEQDAFDIIQEILSDAQGDLNEDLLFYMLDSLRGILDFRKFDYDLYHKLTGSLPSLKMAAYYRHRLGTGFQTMTPVPIHPRSTKPETSEQVEAKPIAQHTPYEINHQRCQKIIKNYKSDAPKVLRKFPSMLTVGDKALYFDAGRNFQFEGAIVDAGCFIGGTTMSLVQGLLQNPLLENHSESLAKLIRVYDLFNIDDDYILEHLERNYPKHDFTKDKTFLGVFENNLSEYANMLDVRPGDVIESGYPDDIPIEVLGIDLCKALPVTDFVVREFFPRLMVGARVIQQDFIHQYHPHIHLSMMILEDFFELDYEVQWGGSVSYILKKPISPEIIIERFGTDCSWYNRKVQNEMLLKKLENQMLYDENKWVIMQVLGIYYSAMNDHTNAASMTTEVDIRFPQFEVPQEVRRLTGV